MAQAACTGDPLAKIARIGAEGKRDIGRQLIDRRQRRAVQQAELGDDDGNARTGIVDVEWPCIALPGWGSAARLLQIVIDDGGLLGSAR